MYTHTHTHTHTPQHTHTTHAHTPSPEGRSSRLLPDPLDLVGPELRFGRLLFYCAVMARALTFGPLRASFRRWPPVRSPWAPSRRSGAIAPCCTLRVTMMVHVALWCVGAVAAQNSADVGLSVSLAYLRSLQSGVRRFPSFTGLAIHGRSPRRSPPD
jgi:hypothetical protein